MFWASAAIAMTLVGLAAVGTFVATNPPAGCQIEGDVGVITDWLAPATSIEQQVRDSDLIVLARYRAQDSRRIRRGPGAYQINIERRFEVVEVLKGVSGQENISIDLTREYDDKHRCWSGIRMTLPEPTRAVNYVLFLKAYENPDGSRLWGFNVAPALARVETDRLIFEPLITRRQLIFSGQELDLPPGTYTSFDATLEVVRRLATQ